MNKIVVTMTSWKGRIGIVPKAISNFMLTQTLQPHVFYLWLAKDEFPGLENDLPKQLLDVMQDFDVQLRWCEKNTYAHKRWNVYPTHYQDYVISIDDDCIYDKNTILNAVTTLNNNPGTVYQLWRQFAAIPTYDNDVHATFMYGQNFTVDTWFSGNSAFAPCTFPLEALSDDVLKIRDKYAPKNDEVWLQPFLLKHGLRMSFPAQQFPFHTYDNTQEDALVVQHGKLLNGYSAGEIAQYYMLKFTDTLELYKSFHPKYDVEKLERALNV